MFCFIFYSFVKDKKGDLLNTEKKTGEEKKN